MAIGSSPRGRGTLRERRFRSVANRFIPAWAGDTRFSSCSDQPTAVHPRVGGGHAFLLMSLASCGGSSPRGRGTLIDPHPFHPASSGSSPRGRGTPLLRHASGPFRRFIPAWAGDTSRLLASFTFIAVHPRVGGGHFPPGEMEVLRDGSSPRGRGTRGARHAATGIARFIPAWAGDTMAVRRRPCSGSVHPRVGGGHSFYKLFKELAFFKL